MFRYILDAGASLEEYTSHIFSLLDIVDTTWIKHILFERTGMFIEWGKIKGVFFGTSFLREIWGFLVAVVKQKQPINICNYRMAIFEHLPYSEPY